jgi:agmatine deiminase
MGRLPAETDPHDRCLVAWPTERRRDFWRGHLDAARDEYAAVVQAIARFEPVLVIADEGEAETAAKVLPDARNDAELSSGAGIDIVELPIDDSWIRDSGPLVVVDDDGQGTAIDFRFNAWGEKFDSWDRDDAMTAALAELLGLPIRRLEMVLEGGSIAADGAGLLVTTERCLLNPNRNPTMSRRQIEQQLTDHLGVEQIVWLPDALTDDDGTDGHVDNVVSFFAPSRCVLQTTADPADPDHAVGVENRRRLAAAGIETVLLDVLPRVECFGEVVEVPYANYYVANGGVVVPTTGHAADDEMLGRIGECLPGRDVVGVPGAMLAFGGGGVHCITMQIPALG